MRNFLTRLLQSFINQLTKNMYCGDDVSSVVVDIGCYQTRAGYSGEDCPRSVIPSLVGLAEQGAGEDVDMVGSSRKVIVGGAELNFKRDRMEIQPLLSEPGIINFDYLEDILRKGLIDQLMINPRDTPLIFTEGPVHNKDLRLKLTEFMFEKFQIPAIYICKSPVLAAFSCGRSTAVILDSGHRQTIATPVHDGFALQKCIIRHDIGGAYLTQELLNHVENVRKTDVIPRFAFKKKLINSNGQEGFDLTRLDTSGVHPSYYNWCKEEITRDLKEEVLYVSEEPLDDRGLETIRSQTYELPDGQSLSFQGERVSLTEKMFQANDKLSTGGFTGLHHMIVESIGRADIDIRRDLFSNVVISGGNTLFKGFLERLQRQIPDISPQNVKVKVVSGSGGGSGSNSGTDRRFSSWVGGSILSSLGSFQQMWMSRQEFEEHGAIMIERKCP